VIGYFVSPRPISPLTAILGVTFALVWFCVGSAYLQGAMIMDVMGYIFMVGILVVLATGGWVLYQDRRRRQP
jgi:hypothetical protein